jgi:bifunctional non-homologous end joining protein LigD
MPPEGLHWAYEIKHDGFRFICRREGDRVRVYSRNGRDWADRVPAIVEAMLGLPVTSATIDGEGVVVDNRGVTDFDRLFAAVAQCGGSRAAFLYAFDLIELNGADLRPQPWIGRREALASVVGKPGGGIVVSDHMVGSDGAAIYTAACRIGLEGIVCKRVDRPYRSGRSRDWVKIKNPDAPAATRIMEW